MQAFPLSAEHLLLRPLEPSDADAVFRACQDPDVLRWTVALPDPYTRADAEAFVRSIAPEGWAADRSYNWAITDPARSGSELLGVVGLKEPLSGRPEVAYWLAAPARGRGLMVRSVHALCGLAFDRFGAEAVLWQALVGNEPSRRVAERLGFRVGDPVPRLIEQRGRWKDGWVGVLEADDEPVPETGRLTDGTVVLRRWELADLPTLANLVDDGVLTWTTFPGRGPDQLRDWIVVNQRVRRAPDARFAIATSTGEAVGSLRLSYDARTGVAGLGWWLGSAARGRGLARRALELALPWAAERGAVRFVAEIYAGNVESVRLAERLGMHHEGVRRGHWPPRVPGQPRRDTLLYGLVPDDAGWPEVTGRLAPGESS